MTEKQKQLWEKISQFQLDDETHDFTFSARLARENDWTLNYAKKVIIEYKKFLFLCCTTATGVTPSDQVDQAWHLHLTYTKSYWIDLCKNILEKEIHHNPTKGGKAEASKFDDFYSNTKANYRQSFESEPPLDVWPNNDKRFSDIHFKRINSTKNWIVKKPTIKLKGGFITLLIAFLSIFLIQATFLDESIVSFIIIILIVGFLINAARKGNDGKGGSSCSSGCTSSSGSDHSGCSGHSGCSSGCGGCGGGD